jgi:menaquinone-dependent protoporphyrinogen oxidase
MTSILVTYASKHGATAEIAQTVAGVIKTFNLDVTARRVEYVDDVSEYDVVILGCALYLGEWITEALDFLATHQAELATKVVWLFVSGPTGDGEAHELLGAALIPDEIRELLDTIAPQEIKLFKGKIDLRRLPPEQRKIVKAAKVARGDYRDWKAIQAWAETIGRSLSLKAIVAQSTQELVLVED